MKISLCFASLLCLFGCADRSGISSTTTSLLDSSYVMSDLQLRRTDADAAAPYVKATAYLQNVDSSSPVYGGILRINGVTVPARFYGHGTTYVGRGDSGTAPLVLDGSWHVFSVPGSVGYPPFIDSVRSPTGATVISTPHSRDTVSKSAGFHLIWNADTHSGVHVLINDTASGPGHMIYDTIMATDPGSLTLTPAMISYLSPGPIDLLVTRGDVKYGIAGAHARYSISIGSTRQITLTLTP